MTAWANLACIIPVLDEHGHQLVDDAGKPLKCGKPVPPSRLPNRLCDDHYEPVSDAAVARYIPSRLAAQKEPPS